MSYSLFLKRFLAFTILFQTSCAGFDDKCQADGEATTPKRNSYELWQHGAARRERTALSAQFKTKVDGKTTHESEHPIGVKVLLGLEAGDPQRGKNSAVRSVENCAPSYQEIKALHRKHIGTPRDGAADASGLSPGSYRKATRALLQDNALSVAIQLNQLSYAFNPDFRGNTIAHQVADASFEHMAKNMKAFSYYEGGSLQEASLASEEDRGEMLVARQIARTGKWPAAAELAAMKADMGQEKEEEPLPLTKPLQEMTINNSSDLDL